jgi:hypothetical protein
MFLARILTSSAMGPSDKGIYRRYKISIQRSKCSLSTGKCLCGGKGLPEYEVNFEQNGFMPKAIHFPNVLASDCLFSH